MADSGNNNQELAAGTGHATQLRRYVWLLVVLWTAVAAVSLGWNLADRGEAQEATKATLYRAALEVMGFDALLLGATDLHSAALAQPFVGGTAYDAPNPPANVPLAKDGLKFVVGV